VKNCHLTGAVKIRVPWVLWTLDDIAWDRFDRTKVDPELLRIVKAASLVEYNGADYAQYLLPRLS